MIRDSGVSGNGSLYGSRFKAGDVISASQLNDLNSGLMTGTVQPYLGAGPTAAYGAGGTQIVYTPDLPIGEVQQFQVMVNGNQVSTACGTVTIQDVWRGTPPDVTTAEYAVTGVYAYPTGSKTIGTTTGRSVFMDSDGYITIANASSGGSDLWGVWIIRQPMQQAGVGADFGAPMVAIFSDSSDADAKTTPWGGGNITDEIRLYSVATATPVDVDGVPSGSFLNNFSANPVQYNYNCQRVKIATIQWDAGSSSWTLTQHLLGSVTLPNTIYYYGVVIKTPDSDPTTYWPQYASQSAAWNGSWSGYDKASTALSGVIAPALFPN